MAQKIKFHLDENIKNAIAQGLRRREIDVTTTPEQCLIGASDEAQLIFAVSELLIELRARGDRPSASLREVRREASR